MTVQIGKIIVNIDSVCHHRTTALMPTAKATPSPGSCCQCDHSIVVVTLSESVVVDAAAAVLWQ